MKAHKGLLHNGEELHNGFTQPKTLDALYSRLTINTQYIFFKCIVWCFSLFASPCCISTWTCSSICSFLETSRWDAWTEQSWLSDVWSSNWKYFSNFHSALNLINSVSEIINYNIEKLYLGYSSIIWIISIMNRFER